MSGPSDLEERLPAGDLRGNTMKDRDDFVFPFEKLEVWQLSVDFADYVLRLLETFPASKHLRLIGQMEAAVCGISQNIAEGKGRQYKKEFIQFLHIAEGSLFEVLTLVEIFKRRKLIKKEEVMNIRGQAEIIDRKLRGLIKSLRGRS
jgi:four helix bundle protein